jgi:nicotinic acid mononucleotide adenylyltransferase
MPTNNRKHIVIFGSSLHPVHTGHLAILQDLEKKFPDAEVWLLPVYNHPDSDINPVKPSADTFEMRCELAEIMVAEYKLEERVKISKVERDAYFNKLAHSADKTKLRVTTLDLLNHVREDFIKNHEDVDISLALGTDVFSDLVAGKWGEEGAAVIGHCKSIICNDRMGYQTGVTCAFMHRMFDFKKKISKRDDEGNLIPFVKKMNIPVEGASSTAIREWIGEGMPEGDSRAEYLSQGVIDRIREKGLYGYTHPARKGLY